jgi:hypothetical protein
MPSPLRRPHATTGLIALFLLTAAGARAADQPATTPARDVDITYRIAGPNGPAPSEQRVRWDVAAGRQRIDPPAPGLHIIIDTRTHHLASVRDAEQLVLEIDQGAITPAAGAPASYTRRGAATVAGLACTVWQTGEAAGTPELCFTDDGVLLRIVTGGQVVAEAVRVTYAPSNPADFEVPPGYRRIVRAQPPPPPPPPSQTMQPTASESPP